MMNEQQAGSGFILICIFYESSAGAFVFSRIVQSVPENGTISEQQTQFSACGHFAFRAFHNQYESKRRNFSVLQMPKRSLPIITDLTFVMKRKGPCCGRGAPRTHWGIERAPLPSRPSSAAFLCPAAALHFY
jgi:hypothetical protein